MADLTKEEIEKLARWYCTLNKWDWPEDMPKKPKNFDNLLWFLKNYDEVTEKSISKRNHPK